MEGLDLGTAQRLVEARQRAPFKSEQDMFAHLPVSLQTFEPKNLSFTSSYFVVRGRLRLGDRVLEEQSLVRRITRTNVVALQRERVSQYLGPR